MRPSEALARYREEIRRVVTANNGKNPRVFGSVLRGQDTIESDLDILIDPTPQLTLFDMAKITLELSDLLGVKVQVQTPNCLPDGWRDEVLTKAQPV